MLSQHEQEQLKAFIRAEIQASQQAMTEDVAERVSKLVFQQANVFIGIQEPVVGGIADIVAAVKDLQKAFDVVAEKLDAIHGEPSPDDDWWKRGDDEPPHEP